MTSTESNTKPEHGKAIFELRNCETGKIMVTFHQWDNGEVTVLCNSSDAILPESEPTSAV